MDTNCINRILIHNMKRIKFLGCFPSDKIPLPITYPSCMVLNTDDSSEAGTHWIAMCLVNPDTVEYFCPLGIPFYYNPLFYNFIRIKFRARDIYFNANSIQTE